MGAFRINLGELGRGAGELVGRVFMLVFALFWLGVSGTMLVALAGSLAGDVRMVLTWRPVPAVITEVRQPPPEGFPEEAAAVVCYEYRAAGGPYKGEFVMPTGLEARGPEAARLAEVLRTGGSVTAWHDPSRPQESTLLPAVRPQSLGFLIFLTPFVVLGLTMLAGAVAGWRLARAAWPGLRQAGAGTMVAYFIFSAVAAFAFIFASTYLEWKPAVALGVVVWLILPASAYLAARALARRFGRAAGGAGAGPTAQAAPAAGGHAGPPPAVAASSAGADSAADLRRPAGATAPGGRPGAPEKGLPPLPGAAAGLASAGAGQGGAPASGRRGVIASRERGFMVLFAIIWCTITGVLAVVVIGGILRQVDAQRRYETTDGVVLASKVRAHSGSDGATYEPAIRYSYKVAGREYVGERYAYGLFSSSDFDHADEVVARHPAGASVTVYYDPADPSEAVLAVGVQPGQWFMLLFLQPFMLVGAGLIAVLAAGVVRRRRMRAFLAQPPRPPCYVPGWGQLRAERDGFKVYPALLSGERLAAFAAGYGLTCFLSIFVVGFLSGFSPPTWAVQAAFGAAAAVGMVAAATDKVVRAPGVLHVDDGAGRLRILRRKPLDVALADLEAWTVSAVPGKWESEGASAAVQPRLAVLTRGGGLEAVHTFPGTGDESFAVARAVGEFLASATGKPFLAG